MQAGTRLGPYEILSPLGAGGMGEVWRARDTRLGRDVAVKVLPDDVATDPRALARFESEARAVAALSHPNILALVDVGKEGAVSFVVMELLEGETLREALAKGPLPLRKALDVALQVAEGLAAAHGKGIVHRDVKPENVFVTKDGRAKLLDFGIARQRSPAGRDETQSPTVDKLTSEGAVVGTVAYMSPEQARGETVDFRSDQFSLGVVLYEMLTGKRPFGGASAAETIAAIIRDEPEPLTKIDPKLALASAGGLTMHDVSRTGRWLVTRDDWRIEISVLASGASAERDLSWLDLSTYPHLSPDGRMLLFVDMSPAAGPNYRVCLRTADGGPVIVLGEGVGYGFSPDGKSVLALIDTPPQLVIYPTGPGETRHLPRGDLEAYHFASWFPDGKSVLVSGNEPGKASRCYQQDLSGGLPRPVTPEGTTNGMASPDGLQILYSTPDGSWLIQRAVGGTAQPVPGLTADGRVIRWSADGRSLYVFHGHKLPYRIERLDLVSGRRVTIREVGPADRAGVLRGRELDLTDDAQYYAYDIARMPSQLFVVEGAR